MALPDKLPSKEYQQALNRISSSDKSLGISSILLRGSNTSGWLEESRFKLVDCSGQIAIEEIQVISTDFLLLNHNQKTISLLKGSFFLNKSNWLYHTI